MDSVEALIRKHDDFSKSLMAQEEKIKKLDEFATKLINDDYFAKEDIAKRRDDLLARREALLGKAKLRRELLDESLGYQLFDRDADELKSWLLEKLKTADDESYKDPTNLQSFYIDLLFYFSFKIFYFLSNKYILVI